MSEPQVIPRLAALHLVTIGSIGPEGPAGPQGVPGAAGGTTITLTAGEALGGHRIVTTNALGQAIYADVSSLPQANSVVGLTLGATLSGAQATVQLAGLIEEPSWSWIPQQPIYLTGLGQLTQTRPTTGNMLQIATPVTATSIILAVKIPVTLL